MILLGYSQNLTHVIVIVGGIGIPLAGAMVVAYAYMLDLIPRERTAEFVGMHLITMSAPMIFRPMLGGTLIDLGGYRLIFPVSAGSILVGLVILQFVRSRRVVESRS